MQLNVQILLRLPPAIYFVLCYFCFQALFIAYIAHGANNDEAELLANIRYFHLGCIGGQPPLYNWLALLTEKIFGTSLLALQIVRFTLLTSLFVSVYGAMRLFGFSQLAATSSMLGLFFIQQIGIDAQRLMTHSIACVAGCAWVLLLFAWHMKFPSWLSAALLGLTMAAALLGKWNAFFFIAALLLAGISLGEYRKILLSKYSYLIVLICVCCLVPTIWTTIVQGDLFSRIYKFGIGTSRNAFTDRIIGSLNLFKTFAAQCILPLGIAGYLLYRNRQNGRQALVPISHKFFVRLFLFQFGSLLIGIIITGVTHVRIYWLLPFLFIISPTIVCMLIRYSGEECLRYFNLISISLSLLLIPIIAISLHYRGMTWNKIPNRALDYSKLFHFLRHEGTFHTILTDVPQKFGQFRLFDPHLNIIHFETPNLGTYIRRPLLIIWPKKNNSQEKLMAILKQANIDLSHEELKEANLFYQSEIAISYYYAIVQ